MTSQAKPFPRFPRIYTSFRNFTISTAICRQTVVSDTMQHMNRRKFIHSAAVRTAGVAAAAALARPALAAPAGRLNQSVCFWTYQKWFTLDALCQEAVRIGLKGIDLVTPAQYATVQK